MSQLINSPQSDLIDAYTIFAASVLAANAVLRSLFGFAFPLFTAQMYENLGIHWASTIPAFLALMCVPFPFLFWKYGPKIRERCKYAAESQDFLRKMQSQAEDDSTEDEEGTQSEDHVDKDKEHQEEREEQEQEQEAIDYSYGREEEQPQFERIRSTPTRPSLAVLRTKSYEGNPFDLDRVNTRESFKWEYRSDQGGSLPRASSKASKASRR